MEEREREDTCSFQIQLSIGHPALVHIYQDVSVSLKPITSLELCQSYLLYVQNVCTDICRFLEAWLLSKPEMQQQNFLFFFIRTAEYFHELSFEKEKVNQQPGFTNIIFQKNKKSKSKSKDGSVSISPASLLTEFCQREKRQLSDSKTEKIIRVRTWDLIVK